METEEILKGIEKINKARKYLMVLYTFDEQGRTLGFKAINKKYEGEMDKSHTFSYMEIRKYKQKEGEIMGFDQELTGAKRK